jgi:hypothetical protein
MREIRPQISFRDYPKMTVPFSGLKTFKGETLVLEWKAYCIIADFHPLTVEQIDKIRAGWKLNGETVINHLSLSFFDRNYALDETSSPVCVLSAQGGYTEEGVQLCDNAKHPRSIIDFIALRKKRPKTARLTIFLHDKKLDMGLAKELPSDRLAVIASLAPLALLKLGAEVLDAIEPPKLLGKGTNGWQSSCIANFRDNRASN